MKFEHFLLLVGGLGIVSVACGCFGLYQYFVYERKRKHKKRLLFLAEQYIPTLRDLYEDNKY